MLVSPASNTSCAVTRTRSVVTRLSARTQSSTERSLEMPYSYGRHFIVDALGVTDFRFSSTRAVDCLWDAEPLIRATAATVVDVGSPEATARLRALAADPAEEHAVRSAADRV
jgi:hypothetical protein